jgi:hypothetical protein
MRCVTWAMAWLTPINAPRNLIPWQYTKLYKALVQPLMTAPLGLDPPPSDKHFCLMARGNTMVEYGLGLATCVLVAAVAFAGLNRTPLFRAPMQTGLNAQVQANTLLVRPSQPTVVNTISPSTVTLPGLLNPAYGVAVTHSQLGSLIETTGVSGTSTLLLHSFSDQLNILRQSGQLTEQQFNSLITLSDQGHHIAQRLALVESMTLNQLEGDQFRAQEVILDGELITVNRVLRSIDNNQFADNVTDLYDPIVMLNTYQASTSGEQMNHFMDLYHIVMDDLSISDPAILQQTQQLVYNIILMSDIFVTNLLRETVPPSQINQLAASQLTHSQSGQICDLGNGNETGQACLP